MVLGTIGGSCFVSYGRIGIFRDVSREVPFHAGELYIWACLFEKFPSLHAGAIWMCCVFLHGLFERTGAKSESRRRFCREFLLLMRTRSGFGVMSSFGQGLRTLLNRPPQFVLVGFCFVGPWFWFGSDWVWLGSDWVWFGIHLEML